VNGVSRHAMPFLMGRKLETNQGPKVLESSLARGPLQCQSEHYTEQLPVEYRDSGWARQGGQAPPHSVSLVQGRGPHSGDRLVGLRMW
jgi:hypothetical protein